jgi:hypothetical protein
VKNLCVNFGEVIPDNAHEVHMGEKTGGHRKIRSRAAQRSVHFPVRTFQSVKRN